MTVAQRVRAILEASRAARNSDKQLWVIYAQKSGVELSSKQISKIEDMPEFETLRRVRQALQASGVSVADPVIKQARGTKSSHVRKNVTYMNPEQLERELQHRRPVPNWLKGIDGH